MKLLIDIPEHIYEHAKETTEDSRDEFDAMRAIANGSQQESRSEIPNTCGDAISREELIEALDTWDKFGYAPTNELVPLRGNVDKDKYVPYIHYDDVIECIKGMPSVTPQQRAGRWIPVSERLPEDEEEVLCFLESEEMAVLFRRNNWGQDEWVDGGFATGSYDVIAWMPLPKPYKAESEVDS